jgi:hypothetical protein
MLLATLTTSDVLGLVIARRVRKTSPVFSAKTALAAVGDNDLLKPFSP